VVVEDIIMHILIGALIGGALFAATYAVTNLVKGDPLSWKGFAGAAAGGVVSGALAATTFGASLLAEGGVGAVGFLAADGAVGSATEQVTDNALDSKPIMQDVITQAAWGAATAPLFYGLFKGVSRFLPAGAIATVAADAEKAVAGVAKDAGSAVEKGAKEAAKDIPRLIRDELGRFKKNPDWKPPVDTVEAPKAPEAPKAGETPKTNKTLTDHLKNPQHHATAGAGFASTGIVAGVLSKVKSMLGIGSSDSSNSSDSTDSGDSTDSKSKAKKKSDKSDKSDKTDNSDSSSTDSNGNVNVSVPANSNGHVKVTVEVNGNNGTSTTDTTAGTNATRAPLHPVQPSRTIPVDSHYHPTNNDGPANRTGITQTIGAIGH
jgi:hypothetical protein